MKKIILILIAITSFSIILIFTANSCSKVDIDKVCDVDDPLTELSWLSVIVSNAEANSQDITISKVILKDKKLIKKIEGFTVRTGDMWTYYNCSGEIICASGGFAGTICDTYDILEEKIIYED